MQEEIRQQRGDMEALKLNLGYLYNRKCSGK